MTDTANLPAATPPQRALARVENAQPLLDSDRFEHFQRASKALMYSSLLPESIRGTAPEQCFSNLMLVFDLSDRWKVPALSIAQCIAIVHNKVVYEGKLIDAMLNAQGLDLDYHYTGDRGTTGYRVYVSDRPFIEMTDEQLAALTPGKYPRGWRMVDGAVGDWQTFQKNSQTPNPAWTGQSQHNQLAYRGAREWCRLYESGLLLGVYGEDEIQEIADRRELRDITPAATGISVGFTAPAPKAGDTVAAVADLGGGPEAITATVGADGVTLTDIQRGAAEPAADATAAAGADAPDTAENAATGKPAGGAAASEPKPDKPKAAKAAKAKDVVSTGEELAVVWDRAFKAGEAGEDGAPPKDIVRSDQQDTWSQGWNAGAAERLADGGGDDDDRDDVDSGAEDESEATGADGHDMLDAIAGAEPELVAQVIEDHGDELEDDFEETAHLDAFDHFQGAVRDMPDWPMIKSRLTALAQEPQWKAAIAAKDGTRPRQARIAAGMRMKELLAAGKASDTWHLDDLTAYRCWLEATDDGEVIIDGRQQLILAPIYDSLTAEAKSKVDAFTTTRLAALQQA